MGVDVEVRYPEALRHVRLANGDLACGGFGGYTTRNRHSVTCPRCQAWLRDDDGNGPPAILMGREATGTGQSVWLTASSMDDVKAIREVLARRCGQPGWDIYAIFKGRVLDADDIRMLPAARIVEIVLESARRDATEVEVREG